MALWRLVVVSAAFSGKRGDPSNSCLPDGSRSWAGMSGPVLYVVIISHGKETAAACFLLFYSMSFPPTSLCGWNENRERGVLMQSIC
jgi:hypothetical protein